MTIEARRVHRGVSGALLALALVLLAAVPVAQADTIYPDNVITGSHFSDGLTHENGSGWTAVSNKCTLLLGLIPTEEPATCNADTTHAAGIGTPPGSLQQSYQPPADGLSPLLFNATTLARSSPFTIANPIAGASGKTTFQFDRRADVQAILDGDSRATYTFTLVDETANTRAELFREVLNDSDNTFRGQLNDKIANVVPGHTYHIELSTLFDTAILSVALQKTIANFDNVRLRVQDGTPAFGGPSAQTDPADEITSTSARLNGRTNARGLVSTYNFRFGTTEAAVTNGTAPTIPGGPFNAGERLTFEDRSRTVSGLTECTKYFFRIEITNAVGSDVGSTLSFSTACKPTVETLAVVYGTTSAIFSSRINPNSLVTKYWYEYGLAPTPTTPGDFASRIPAAGSELTIPAGSSDVAPNSYPVDGLVKDTIYQVRIVASNSSGAATGLPKTFKTNGDGAQGPQGVQGPQGAQGPAGAQGTPGTNGTNGAPGPIGPQGPAGTPGARGPQGAAGTQGQSGVDSGTVDSSSRLAMIRIDAQRIVVPMKGRNIGRVRVRIFCRSVAVRTCSGNMKVRSLNKIAPHSFGLPPKPQRRVSFATDAVQLDVRKIGFGILNFNAQRRSVLRREGRVVSTVIVTVIDANNNRQNVRKVVTVVRGAL